MRTTSNSGWDLNLLGCWRLRHHGETIDVGPRQQRVISVLALRGARSRHYLADLLWPGSSESQAAGSLRSSVFRISHELPSLLSGDMDPLTLGEHVTVDLDRVRGLISDIGDDGGAVPPGGAAIDVLRSADLLPGWYEDWVLFEQERLQLQRLFALEALARRYLATGQTGLALDAAKVAASIEPFRESARLIMLRAYLADDNYASAVHEYENFRSYLDQELGAEPSSKFRELLLEHLPPVIRSAPRQVLR
ncbi:AfsR/SARP family transcriptional regulator [Specibacter cremeus]|uniref:AfsR/SARP family transcriptional regulator n=1 Tax=Specibacter cremeus TaxID=1629051 RepID=UPI000F7661F9|nr:BTAD domain-containing putative transcriptional regulator [Specibacter cremeus]